MKQKEKKPKSKTRKIIEWVFTIIIGALFVFAATCNVAKLTSRNKYGYGSSFGYGVYVVETGSMEPIYKKKTAIITYAYDPEEIIQKFEEIRYLGLSKDDPRNVNLTFVDAKQSKVDCGVPGKTDQTNVRNYTDVPMTHQMFGYKINESIAKGSGRYTFFVEGINTEGVASKEHQYQAFTEVELLGQVKKSSPVIGFLANIITSVWGLLICLMIPALYLIITSVIDIVSAVKDDDESDSSGNPPSNSKGIEGITDKEYEKLKQQMIDEMLNQKGGK